MRIGVLKERGEGEKRVALIPDHVKSLTAMGLEVFIESGAGQEALFPDGAYVVGGGKVVERERVFEADIVLKVGPPQREEVGMLRKGTILIGFLDPLGNPALVREMAARGITALSMEFIPRISRAQSMDALSSQASVAGYKAVLIAANSIQRFFPMLTTAAGTVRPAKVLVVGAGVAGLQAIATARRLGAVVEAFDIRPEVKEEVESLGARFVEMEVDEEVRTEEGYAREVSEDAKRREKEVLARHVAGADVVITTALVPGRRAPLLITEEMVSAMEAGSVIVDLAAEQGGNCELTRPGEEVTYRGVMVLGPVNLPSSMANHASQMYSRNLLSLLKHMIEEGRIVLDFEDEIIDSLCTIHGGEIRNRKVLEGLEREG